MRDAVGGSFMIKVFIVFLGVYIVFMAVALNYAKAFRVKNQIINIIEQNEGIDADDYNDKSNNSSLSKIYSYLAKVSYTTGNDVAKNKCETGSYIDDRYIFCINTYTYDKNKTYYKVTTFVSLELPFFGINIPVPIKGETRMIERITE